LTPQGSAGTLACSRQRDGTSAHGRLQFHRDRVDFTLRYTNLTAAPSAAHLHLGERHVNAGDILSPATGTPSVAQGLPAGNLEAAKRSIRAGAAYANVHNANRPAGEIRGQVVGD
jgi:hypothetical protein